MRRKKKEETVHYAQSLRVVYLSKTPRSSNALLNPVE